MGNEQSAEQSLGKPYNTFPQKDETRVIHGRTIKKTFLHPPQTKDKLAFILDGVFTEEECQEWIAMTEKQGYEPALVNIGGGRQELMPDVRNNSRCIIDSHEMANRIFDIIKEFLPETCTFACYT